MIKISVIMTNYNYGNFVSSAINAIIKQKDYIYEYIIIDDASTDNSMDIIESLIKNQKFINFKFNDSNLGGLKSYHKAKQLSQGNYIFSEASDDYVLPNFFKSAYEMFSKYPDVGLFTTNPVYLNIDTNIFHTINLNFSDKLTFISPEEFVEILNGRFIFGHCAIVNAGYIKKYGGSLVDLKWHYDWFLHLVIAFRHGICYAPIEGAVMREHSISYSAYRPWNEQKLVIKNIIKYLQSDKYRDVYPMFVKSKALNHFTIHTTLVLVMNPSLLDKYTIKILYDTLFCWMRGKLSPFIPSFIKKFYHKI
jgi:glycosyltransferase involved in cell wall biosynthesis